MAKILLVDDDGHIREVVRFALTGAGHDVVEAKDGSEACDLFAQSEFDLVVLDVVMPEMDGLDVCRRIRADSTVPVIFLSSRDEELDRIIGLELGADDYITKPFSPRELVARVKAALRRYDEIRALRKTPREPTEEASTERLEHRELKLDVERHECLYRDQAIPLTVTEFGLLRSLIQSPGRVYSRQQLVQLAYGADHFISARTVDSHIRRVRKKLMAVDADVIETVFGVGYRLKDS